jgi:hypothetical protein
LISWWEVYKTMIVALEPMQLDLKTMIIMDFISSHLLKNIIKLKETLNKSTTGIFQSVNIYWLILIQSLVKYQWEQESLEM